MTDTVGALPADHVVETLDDLALMLGGERTSFTGHLLSLIAHADIGNRARLRRGFPRQVAAWEIWMSRAPLPAGVLAGLIADVPDLTAP